MRYGRRVSESANSFKRVNCGSGRIYWETLTTGLYNSLVSLLFFYRELSLVFF